MNNLLGAWCSRQNLAFIVRFWAGPRQTSRRANAGAKCGSLYGGQEAKNVDLLLPVIWTYDIARKQRVCMVQTRVSLVQFRLLLGHCFGAYATPGGRLALLLCYHPATQQSRAGDPGLSHPPGYGFHLRWTLRKCRASALGVAPTRIASPGVTRADREFKNGD